MGERRMSLLAFLRAASERARRLAYGGQAGGGTQVEQSMGCRTNKHPPSKKVCQLNVGRGAG